MLKRKVVFVLLIMFYMYILVLVKMIREYTLEFLN